MSKFSRKGLMQLSVFFGFISFAGASEGRLPVWCFPCTTSECITQIQECSAKRNTIESMNGGSMYASTDPFFMIMLMKILGKDFVVWDKGCTIRFKRPAKTTLFAEFLISPEMLSEVKASVSAKHECTFTWTISYKDQEGVVYSEFDKVLYVAKKDFYLEKQKRRSESKKLP